MKKIFIITLITAFTFGTACAQLSVGMHSGISNKNLIIGLHSQYEFKNRFTAGFNLTTHTDNSNPAFLQSRFGYTLGKHQGLSIQPYMGYSYSIKDAQKKGPVGQLTEGVQIRYHLRNVALIYTDLNVPVRGFYTFSIGIAGHF